MSEVKHELIPLADPQRWNEVLHDIPHSFGHTWENSYAMNLTTGYPTFLYYFNNKQTKIVCPIAEREYEGYIDIVTPYGFSGFVGNNDCTHFQSHWKEFARSKGYVCGYIGLNPIFENSSYLDQDNVFEYHCIYILNLQSELDQLLANLSTNRKRQLKQLKNQQHSIIHDKSKLKEFFLSNYHSFFQAKQHARAYDLTSDTLVALIDGDNVLLNGIYIANDLKAVSMFGYTPFCADYLFTISFEKDLAFPLIWDALTHFKTWKIPMLNLGGGVKKGDSIAQFKERFGGIKLPLKCLKQIYNSTIYESLREKTTEQDSNNSYFPVYRSG